MKRKIQVLTVLFFVAIFIWPAASFGQKGIQQKEQKALKAADKFLALVDAGQYAKSYKETSSLFQHHVREKEWVSRISRTRSTFGAVASRKMAKAKYLTNFLGAPEGDYYLLVFQTSFKDKAHAIELVTTQKGAGGEWKVCGYVLR